MRPERRCSWVDLGGWPVVGGFDGGELSIHKGATMASVKVKLGRLSADDLTPTKWSSADDKARSVNAVLSFIEKGMPREQFERNNRLYHVVSQYNAFGSHIAHYDRYGFAHRWFSSDHAKLEFLERAADSFSAGDPRYTWSDAATIVSEMIRESGLIEEYRARLGR
jgi:hypothetical protein